MLLLLLPKLFLLLIMRLYLQLQLLVAQEQALCVVPISVRLHEVEPTLLK